MKKIIFLLLCFTAYVGLAQPTNDAPTPTNATADVISIYSDAYTNIATNYNPFWGQSGTVNTAYDPTGMGSNFVMEYANFNYQGTDVTASNASSMEYLHIDIWTNADPTATDIQVSPINNGTGAAEVLVSLNYTQGAWTSVDIPKSDFTGMTWDSVFQLKFAANGAGSTVPVDIYLDNIYFWKTPTAAGSDATLSDLQVDNATIAGFDTNDTSYTVGLVEGSTTIPQVTSATTTDSAATYTITQATAVPGSATVEVTAQDGTTMQTYTVNFEITIPMGPAPTPPARPTADVVSIFSNAYTNITLDELPTSWSDTGFQAIQLAGDDTWQLTGCEFLGMVSNYATGVDISNMDFLHIDYWAATDTPNELLVKLVNTVDGGEDFESLGATVMGTWKSIDIDLTLYDTGGNLSNRMKITQLLIDSVNRGNTFYIDNFYFHKGTTLGATEIDTNQFTVYPNPSSNNWNIKATSTIQQVSVYNLLGKQVYTATPNSEQVLIDASNLVSGIYFAKVSTALGVKTIKLVRE